MENESFTKLIIELLKQSAGFFDLGYTLLFFFSNLVILKKTVLVKKSKIWKQTFVLIWGMILGCMFLIYQYLMYGIAKSVQFSVKIGISMFATILFYDLVFKRIKEYMRGSK